MSLSSGAALTDSFLERVIAIGSPPGSYFYGLQGGPVEVEVAEGERFLLGVSSSGRAPAAADPHVSPAPQAPSVGGSVRRVRRHPHRSSAAVRRDAASDQAVINTEPRARQPKEHGAEAADTGSG